MKEADYYNLLENGKIKCMLCPHNCIISNGKSGICGVRRHADSKLITDIYGMLTSIAIDPIEKKPLYHFYPSSEILSIGTKGCNMKCPYCQNWHISQDMSVETSFYSAESIVNIALEKNSIGIAYTYSEPVIWLEYVLDCSKPTRERGVKNVMGTNGFINEEPLNDLLEYTDAMNIDLKTFNEDTYKKVQKGNLTDILNTIKISHEKGCSIEITTLVVSGINDNFEEMKDIINFIASVDKNIPWHISRYYPNYKYEKPATSIEFGGIMAIHAPFVVPLVPHGPNCSGRCSLVDERDASTYP